MRNRHRLLFLASCVKLSRSQATKKPADPKTSGLLIKPGSVLLSHSLTAAVSSALEDLTSVFEMGTGVTPPAWPPGTLSVSREALGVRREVIPKNQTPLRLTLHAPRALKTVST